MKKTVLALAIPYLLSAHTIPELFDALKNHSQTKVDEMVVKKAKVSASQATSQLYPTVNLFGTYDNYSSPSNMKPLAPNVMQKMLAPQSTIAQPYSYNIYKGGVKFTMPIFVKAIYTMADKAKAMQQSAKAKKRINLLKNEAIIVGSNANLQYLRELKKSLDLKEKSLLETEKTVKIKVDNGRAPESALYKINDALNQINIAKNNIALQKQKLVSSIETITGIRVDAPAEMQEVQGPQEGAFGSLKPLEEKLKASRLEMHAQKEKLYPTVVAHGSYVYSTAKSYNNHKNVNEEFGDIGIVVTIPLLAMNQYESIKKSKVEMLSDEVALQKLRDELQAKADMLKTSLPLLDNSMKLAKRSIQNKEKLLKIAKVNYNSGRLSTEEYLRYEDDVVGAKAKLYEAKAQKWQTQMQLAVIYANNIEEMVR